MVDFSVLHSIRVTESGVGILRFRLSFLSLQGGDGQLGLPNPRPESYQDKTRV